MKRFWERFINMNYENGPYEDLPGIMISGGYGRWLRWGGTSA
jgi:hypothetical protein